MDSDVLMLSLWFLGLILLYWGIKLRSGKYPEHLFFWFFGSLIGSASLPVLMYFGLSYALSLEYPTLQSQPVVKSLPPSPPSDTGIPLENIKKTEPKINYDSSPSSNGNQGHQSLS